MSTFKVGTPVRIVHINAPDAAAHQHLIGKTGEVIRVTEGPHYPDEVRLTDGDTNIYAASELEAVK